MYKKIHEDLLLYYYIQKFVRLNIQFISFNFATLNFIY